LEFQAATDLASRGFRPFLPLEIVAAARGPVYRPLFTNYVLVALDLDVERWRDVAGAYGVVRLMGDAERPSPARRGAIETLIDQCNDSGVVSAIAPPSIRDRYPPGAVVRAVDGPFAGVVGIVQLAERERLRVLFSIFGREAPVEMGYRSVERV
jgi:transcriptional antiterminator NusG